VLLVDTSTPPRTTIRDRHHPRRRRPSSRPRPDTDQVAIVKFGGDVVTISDFTADKDQLRANIDTLAASGERRLWDDHHRRPGLRPAPTLEPTGAHHGGRRRRSKLTGADAAPPSSCRTPPSSWPAQLRRPRRPGRAAQHRWRMGQHGDPAELPGLLAGREAALDNQFRRDLPVEGHRGRSPSPSTWRVRTSVLANPGTLAQACSSCRTVVRGASSSRCSRTHSRMLIVILVVAAVVTFAGAIVLIFVRRDDASPTA